MGRVFNTNGIQKKLLISYYYYNTGVVCLKNFLFGCLAIIL